MLLTGQSRHTSLLSLSRIAAYGMTSSTIEQSRASGSIAVRSSCPVRVLRSSQSRRRTSQPRQPRAIPGNRAARSSGTSSSNNWHGPSSPNNWHGPSCSKPSSRHNLREFRAARPRRSSALCIEQPPSRGVGSSLAASAARHSNRPGSAQQLQSPTSSAIQQPLF
jgi:hypothetical protein